MSKSYLTDNALKLMAGIDPASGLPTRVNDPLKSATKEDIKKALRIIDEQDAVNRGTWYNLPCNLTSQELERMLYYKGQLAFFYIPALDEFYFMPYALDGTCDFYGRFNSIHPVPMNHGTKEENKAQREYLANIKLKVVYGIKDPAKLTAEDLVGSAVLLHDYTKQLSETILPRQTINDPILDVMAEMVPMMATSLNLSSGVTGVRVNDADQAGSVNDAAKAFKKASLNGLGYVPIVGNVDFQELANKQSNSQEYLLAMQGLDNLRLSTYGIDNGGLFEKKAHTLQSEADINGGPVGLVMQDYVSIRQNFCNIVNSIWGTSIWYEPAENIIGADIDGDGLEYNRDTEGANTGKDNDNANVSY